MEFEGTYPLPEAQLDRFLLKIEMGVPEEAAEIELYRRGGGGRARRLERRAAAGRGRHAAEARALRRAPRAACTSRPSSLPYLARLAAAVRRSPHVELGVSPRGALSLLEAARAGALLAGRDFVLPDDLKRFLCPAGGTAYLTRGVGAGGTHARRSVLDEAAARSRSRG